MDGNDWTLTMRTGVGGVVAVSVPDESRVVVGSHSGLGVFDAVSGERMVRLTDEKYSWFDEEECAILLPGGQRATERLPSMGLWGGALPTTTADGWGCGRVDGGVALVRGAERVLVEDGEEFRAAGFSPAGSVFVLATSPFITVLRRAR